MEVVFQAGLTVFLAHLSIDMTLQKWAIFIMGVYGEISLVLSDQAEILFPVLKNPLTHILKVSARNIK